MIAEVKETILLIGSVSSIFVFPAFVYLLKLEKRLTRGDMILDSVKKDCPIFNLGRCPGRKDSDSWHGKNGVKLAHRKALNANDF